MTIPKKMIPIGMIAGAVILGAVLGSLLIAPKILAAKFGPPPDQAEVKKHEKKGGRKGEEAALFEIKNIIVNPAGSQGTHFLMASIAFQVEDSKVDEQMRAQEVQIQDVVISTLEGKSMEVLTRPGIREELKRELGENVRQLLECREEVTVYLPQFVIQ